MAILPLVIAPNTLLQQKSLPIANITTEIQTLAHNMLETMYANDGIGLSAVQVGVLKRLITVDIKQDKKEQFIMINPEIIENSSDQSKYNEGCLSFPHESVTITRPEFITVTYLDLEGKQQTIKADGLFATCIQHEIDHLNGITISSYISPLKRTMMLKRLTKLQHQ